MPRTSRPSASPSSTRDRVRWRVLLVSASPRRRKLLAALGIPHRVVAHDADELEVGHSPAQLARLNARRKAEAARLPATRSRRNKVVLKELVLSVDTIVVLGRQVLGKPRHPADAERMIRALSGRTHEVISGLHLAVRDTDESVTLSASTRVTFRSLDRGEIRWYVRTGEGEDKAGAYGIQGLGALLVDRIDGCFFNVVGFPLGAFREALRRLSIPLEELVQRQSASHSIDTI